MYAPCFPWPDSLKWMNADSDVKVEARQVPVWSMVTLASKRLGVVLI